MPEQKELWGKVLNSVSVAIPRSAFNAWFKNTEINKIDSEGVVYVSVPNEFAKEWLFSKYHTSILKHLREYAEGIRGLEYTVSRSKPVETPPEIAGIVPVEKLPLPEIVDKRDNLNPRYTFETFILGSFNEVAYTAAQAIMKSPGMAYNPFFVYGGTGLGKTHLIQSVGNQIKKDNPNVKIHYITSEKFSSEYVSAVPDGMARLNAFKEKYRKFDVLIVDDIQFLSNKERTQDELFHLFNFLYEANKQIIFSSDTHPSLIPGLAERIRSRCLSGMLASIDQPEFESRFSILKQKAHEKNFFPEEQVLEFIASAIQGNIRELEGILTSLICQTQLKKRHLTLAEVKHLIRNNTREKKTTSVKDVIRIVANFYDIEEQNIYEKTRRKEIVKPRQIAMYLLREDFSISYPVIGQKLGGRDHTTVIHSCEKIKNDVKNNNTLYQEIERLRALL